MSRSQFEEDHHYAVMNMDTVRTSLSTIQWQFKDRDISGLVFISTYVSRTIIQINDFIDKYDRFFGRIDKKFGTKAADSVKAVKTSINSVKNNLSMITLLASQSKFEPAETTVVETLKSVESLRQNFNVVATLPVTIDYARLDRLDWKMVGIAGVHYRTKIFLSYPSRNDNPTKDENQMMIDYYIKPVLELLNIEPVTAREHLQSQDLVDDAALELVRDSDGIIGFYTDGNDVSNIEHEVAQNDNIVALCVEKGAKSPSIRLSRLQKRFDRSDVSYLIIELIHALKDKGAFRLYV